jgi:GNAT superfamily N-acetyltransferase
VRAWTVWTRDGDERAVNALESAGTSSTRCHRRWGWRFRSSAGIPARSRTGAASGTSRRPGLSTTSPTGIARGLWAGALAELPEGLAHLHLARQDGEPASMVLVHDHEGDCAFRFATVPAAQRRGLTSGLLHWALTDARARGCETSTTQATAMGRPVYARLGYRDLGPVPDVRAPKKLNSRGTAESRRSVQAVYVLLPVTVVADHLLERRPVGPAHREGQKPGEELDPFRPSGRTPAGGVG